MNRTVYKWGRYYLQYSPIWIKIQSNIPNSIKHVNKAIQKQNLISNKEITLINISFNDRLMLGYKFLIQKSSVSKQIKAISNQKDLQAQLFFQQFQQKGKIFAQNIQNKPNLLFQFLVSSSKPSLQQKMAQQTNNQFQIRKFLHKNLFVLTKKNAGQMDMVNIIQTSTKQSSINQYYEINEMNKRLFIKVLVQNIIKKQNKRNLITFTNDTNKLNILTILFQFLCRQLYRLIKYNSKSKYIQIKSSDITSKLQKYLLLVKIITQFQNYQEIKKQIDQQQVMDWISVIILQGNHLMNIQTYLKRKLNDLKNVKQSNQNVKQSNQIEVKGFSFINNLNHLIKSIKIFIQTAKQLFQKEDKNYQNLTNIDSKNKMILQRLQNFQSNIITTQKYNQTSQIFQLQLKLQSMKENLINDLTQNNKNLLSHNKKKINLNLLSQNLIIQIYLWSLFKQIQAFKLFCQFKEQFIKYQEIYLQEVNENINFIHTYLNKKIKSNQVNGTFLSQLIIFNVLCKRLQINITKYRQQSQHLNISENTIVRKMSKSLYKLQQQSIEWITKLKPKFIDNFSKIQNHSGLRQIINFFMNIYIHYDITYEESISLQQEQWSLNNQQIIIKLINIIISYNPSISILLNKEEKYQVRRVVLKIFTIKKHKSYDIDQELFKKLVKKLL